VATLDGVADVTPAMDGAAHVLVLRAQDAPRTVEALVALARTHGIEVVDLAVLPATLEDVFLATTGRELGGS